MSSLAVSALPAGGLQPSSMSTPADAAAGRTPDTVLEGRGLVKRFGQTEALRGIDVRIAAGEIVAVMGPSGSGKSTLLHCLAGILRPDEGEVVLDGRRIDALGEAYRTRLRRTAFGFVFQFGQLVPELPAIENVALPLLLDGRGRAVALKAAAAWFPRLGLDGLEGRRPGEMSGGQAQRVAVARALVLEPRVVFADEPTGSLDSLAGEQVMELLTGAVRATGTTVVLVTHEPRIAAYADREIIVRDGRIAPDSPR
jgi:putative ABC transport system ATP-binding protein